jgi:uncharacterized Ntn-hydrolase superfamily protein
MTYSIVARDPANGELGVAVQSHWFSVGAIVPWGRPGVGTVATQANAEVAYGPRALELLAAGATAREALDELVAADPHRASRQVAIVDARGMVAAHTGEGCLAFAGDVQAEGVSCQANIMARPTVWPAMLRAYATATGDLTARLLAALHAAEAQGGDLRGRQSAAILVVPDTGDPWDTVVSLRVEDHPDPLAELARLVALHEAYRLADRADERVAAGRHDEAAPLYMAAAQKAPDADELRFWAGLGAAHGRDMDGALAHLRAAVAVNPAWLELLRRLPAQDAPAAPALLERLGASGRSITDPAAPPG